MSQHDKYLRIPLAVKNPLGLKFPANKERWPFITTCNNNSGYLEKQLNPGGTIKTI